MGFSQSKSYDVEKGQKEVEGKSYKATKKEDPLAVQRQSEVKTNLKAAEQRNKGINGEEATTPKDDERKIGENPENTTKAEEEMEELNGKTRITEPESPKFEKVTIKHENEAVIAAKTAEGAKIEENLVEDKDNQNDKNEPLEKKQESGTVTSSDKETIKEKQELLNEILKDETKNSEQPKVIEEKSVTHEITEQDIIIAEMIKATVNPHKREENKDTKYDAQQRNVSDIPKENASVSTVYTVEENQQKTTENENKIIVEVNSNEDERIEKVEEIPKIEKHQNIEEIQSNEVETMEKEDQSRIEAEPSIDVDKISKIKEAETNKSKINENQDKLQSERKSDSAVIEEVKKKVEFELPNQKKAVEVPKPIEVKANDVRTKNEAQINAQEEISREPKQLEEIVVERSTEEDQLRIAIEEPGAIKADRDMEEASHQNKEMERAIHNEEIKVDIEVYKIKEENQVNTKLEENKKEEENQLGNITEVKIGRNSLEENTGKENYQKEEGNNGEDQKPNEINQGSTSEISESNTEVKDKEEIGIPSIIDESTSKTVTNLEQKEEIPKEVNPSSHKSEETEPSKHSQGQTVSQGEPVISKEIQPVLQIIEEIEEEAKVLKEQIIHFTGNAKDIEYSMLNEALIKKLLKLDDLTVEKSDEIRSERKRVIKFVQECISTLERNVVKTKDDDDSDSD